MTAARGVGRKVPLTEIPQRESLYGVIDLVLRVKALQEISQNDMQMNTAGTEDENALTPVDIVAEYASMNEHLKATVGFEVNDFAKLVKLCEKGAVIQRIRDNMEKVDGIVSLGGVGEKKELEVRRKTGHSKARNEVNKADVDAAIELINRRIHECFIAADETSKNASFRYDTISNGTIFSSPSSSFVHGVDLLGCNLHAVGEEYVGKLGVRLAPSAVQERDLLQATLSETRWAQTAEAASWLGRTTMSVLEIGAIGGLVFALLGIWKPF
jgi:hypothetical protein